MSEVVSEMKYYEDPAPSDTPTSEGDFETKGKAALAAVDAQTPTFARTGSSTGGDSDGGAVEGWARWFSDLQDKLSAAVLWSDEHEAAHKLLYRYAMWKVGTQWGMSPVVANVEYLFRFLGKAEDNQAAISRMNTAIRRTGGVLMTDSSTFFGTAGAAAWCAPASSIPIQKVLEKQRMYMKDGGDPQGAWATKTRANVTGEALSSVELTPGDYIRVVGHSSPLSGHIATVIKADPRTGPAQKIWYVSGNAGRFGGGAVRVDSVTREQPPEGYSYRRVSDLGNDRDTLKQKIRGWQKHADEVRSQSRWNDKQYDNLPDATKGADDYEQANVQRPVAEDEANIARAQAQIKKDDQAVLDEAKKARPGENPANLDEAEKMLKPKTKGFVWLTYVATTGKMDLNALKPSSDPSMASWMTRWRVASHRSQ